MASVRPFENADLGVASDLVRSVGWERSEADWRRLSALTAGGGFVAETEGKPVGVAFGIVHKVTGWVHTVVVREGFRKKGVGTLLMRAVIGYLTDNGVLTVKLDASQDGTGLYLPLGFRIDFRIARLGGRLLSSGGREIRGLAAVAPLASDQDLSDAVELDRSCSGDDRARLLGLLYEEGRGLSFIARRSDGSAAGYSMGRRSAGRITIGPVVSPEPAVALALARTVASKAVDEEVRMSMLVREGAGLDIGAPLGLQVLNHRTRMSLGKPVIERGVWAEASIETG